MERKVLSNSSFIKVSQAVLRYAGNRNEKCLRSFQNCDIFMVYYELF